MRAIGLAALVAVLLVLPVPEGRASDPVGGGRYVDRTRGNGASLRIKLTLANDGKEFAVPSWALVRIGNCSAGWNFASENPADELEAVPVLPGGRFDYVRYGSVFRGRFIREGRMAVGRVSASCARASVRFRARLTGTPNAARPGEASHCDRVVIRYSYRKQADDGYEPAEQGLGCTTARALAKGWDASEECASLPGPGPTCAVGGAVCERIVGGVWRARASVRCSMPDQPGNAAEFVYQEACLPPPYDGGGDFALWAINLDCATARSFPIDQFLDARKPPCAGDLGNPPPDWCTLVAGYTCAGRSFAEPVIGYNAFCRLDADPFKALRLEFDGGI